MLQRMFKRDAVLAERATSKNVGHKKEPIQPGRMVAQNQNAVFGWGWMTIYHNLYSIQQFINCL